MSDQDIDWNNMSTTISSPWLGAVGSTITTNGLYTSVGSNGSSVNWSDTYTVNTDIKGASLQVKGNAEFEGDVTIQGKSIRDSLERIEERLAILRPNEELEEKWENLRGLRKMYMELEAEIIEKEKMWGILKK